METGLFTERYNNLNTEQKRAVDTIEGPVMVVAGPGTGKTQVLALRIAQILQKTDVGPSAILCLTFTRSGVAAMRNRLATYIGATAREVEINTFHTFAGQLVEKYYELLDFTHSPELLDDTQSVLLIDELLEQYEWEYLRPRTNPTQYFSDLKQLISILKRERMTPSAFLEEVKKEIISLQEDPESFSSRGTSKGQLKKEVEKKIESLKRTEEVVLFYERYEAKKYESGFMDYDDVLEYAVRLVEISEDVRAELQETYQYVLIDEHQDSSGVQNAFLKAVWSGVEKPNIFVVGDDRQLIYGFSGASLSYFQSFSELFGKATLITLIENYRSTAPILSVADDLLQSSVTKEKLKSNTNGKEQVELQEYYFERDEILGAGTAFKEFIAKGVHPSEIALLVPKNRHVRAAVGILRDMQLPVAIQGGASFFLQPEAQSLLKVLRVVANPFETTFIADTLLDRVSGISAIDAHQFLYQSKNTSLTLEMLTAHAKEEGFFQEQNQLVQWGKQLTKWIELLTHERLSVVVSTIGTKLLIETTNDHTALLHAVETVRTLLHLVLRFEEKETNPTLQDFLEYLDRLESYGNHIELASIGGTQGISVLTLHKSKGLEFKYVWIAHVNEETLMAEKKSAFTLPESIKNRLSARDKEVVKRELYVALTRAKEFCTISYATERYTGGELHLSDIVLDLPQTHFIKKEKEVTEKALLLHGPQVYIPISSHSTEDTRSIIRSFVKEHFAEIKVSVTLLNNFFECPWKWYFRNFLKLPEVKTVSLALGSAVHGAIEFVLKEAAVPTKIQIEQKIVSFLKKEGIYNEKEITRLKKDAIKAVTNWIDLYYEALAKDRVAERSLQFKDPQFPALQMYGKIDLTERFSDGTIVVTDFKTGSVKTATTIEKITEDGRLSDYLRQLAMYSYLIKGTEKGNMVSKSRLLFVEADKKDKNALFETSITDEQIDLLLRDIQDYQSLLENGKWIQQKCNVKPYGTVTECQYCQFAKNILK